MTDLTQKILSLDLEIASQLNHVNTVSMEAKREADLHAEHQMEEAQQLFEKEKNSDLQELVKSLKANHERAIDTMHQKMEAFDKDLEIDELLEYLLAVAKDRVCR